MDKADLYVEANTNQYKDAAEILEAYKDRISWNEGDQVLDIGCGPGNTTANLIFPLIPPTAHLLGCDISVNMIKFAQKHFENDRLKFTTLNISADNTTAVLGKESFDKVVSFYCLHWILDQRKLAENIWKLMKPNGVALLVFVTNSSIYTMYNLVKRDSRWKQYMLDVEKYISPYHETENPCQVYSTLMESVGFKIFECYRKTVPVNSPSLLVLKKSLEAVNPFISRIPNHLQNDYMECIMETIVKHGLIKIETINNQEQLLIPPNEILIAFCQKIKLQ